MGKTLYHAAAMVLLVALCGGCSMCQQCELDTYSASGGRWQRTDRDHGRVGSLFAPAGALVPYDASADPHAVPADERSAAPGLRPPGSGEAPGDDAPEARAPEARAPGDSVLQTEEEREAQEARERRLRELQLEDIRFQK